MGRLGLWQQQFFGLAGQTEAKEVSPVKRKSVWRKSLTLFGHRKSIKSDKDAESVIDEELPFEFSSPQEGLNVRSTTRAVVPQRINFDMAQSSALKFIIDFAALHDGDWERRREAVTRLGLCYLGGAGEFNEEAANVVMPALRAAIRDEHWEVRAQAARSMMDLGPVAVSYAVPVLWEACSDPEEPVRLAAFLALQAHGQEAPQAQQPRIKSRAWHYPPSLECIRERDGPSLDSESECSFQQELSTTDEASAQSSSSSSRSCRGSPRASSHVSQPSSLLTSEFTMSVARPPGSSLGLRVAYSDKDILKVLSVQEGIVKDWNKRQACVAALHLDASPWRIDVGDRILAVNGQSGNAEELMDMLQEGTWLEVSVQQQQPPTMGECLSI